MYRRSRFFFVPTSSGRPHYWLPRRILLIRHGESEANVRREVYSTTPDWKIELTSTGRAQAKNCGQRLRQMIKDEKLYIYYSPYSRARQTLEEMRKSLDSHQILGEREDERLREQEMGNFQPMDEMDRTWQNRSEFGRLYFRFPGGESSADVGDRVSSFFDSMMRERVGMGSDQEGMTDSMESSYLSDSSGFTERPPFLWSSDPVASFQEDENDRFIVHKPGTESFLTDSSLSNDAREQLYTKAKNTSHLSNPNSRNKKPSHASLSKSQPPTQLSVSASPTSSSVSYPNKNKDQNVVIVSHGLLIRLFIGRWFRAPMEVFETMRNPPNCSIVVLERNDKTGRMEMSEISKSLFGSDPLLDMVKFDGGEYIEWYREKFFGI